MAYLTLDTIQYVQITLETIFFYAERADQTENVRFKNVENNHQIDLLICGTGCDVLIGFVFFSCEKQKQNII